MNDHNLCIPGRKKKKKKTSHSFYTNNVNAGIPVNFGMDGVQTIELYCCNLDLKGAIHYSSN